MDRQTYDEQDRLIRSLMEEGTENVPDRLWEGISGRLDAGEHLAGMKVHRHVWKRALIAVSSSAAVLAAGLLIWQATWKEEIPAMQENLVAEQIQVIFSETQETLAEVHETEIAATPEKPMILAADEGSLAEKTLVSEEIPETEEIPTVEDVPEIEETAESEGTTGESVAKKEEWTGRNLEDSFPAETGETVQKRSGSGFSLDISGNAAGNVSTGKVMVTHHHSSSIIKPLKTGVAETGNAHNELPLSFGIGVRYNITPKWALATGITYTCLNRKFDGIFNDHIEATSTPTAIRNTQHYIGIPVNAFYTILKSDKIDFYTWFGGAVEKNVGNRYRLLDLDNRLYKEKVKGVQWSANIGLGVEFIVAPWLGIYIDPSLRYYFKNNQPASIRTVQPLSIGAEIGLRTRF